MTDNRQQLLDEISSRLEPYKDVLSGVDKSNWITVNYVLEFPNPVVEVDYQTTADLCSKWFQSVYQIPPEMLVFDKRSS